jgi:hypothetical protein
VVTTWLKHIYMTVFLTVVLIVFAGMAYWMGLPIVQGYRQYGWETVLAAIIAGAMVGVIMLVTYTSPKWIGWLVRRVKMVTGKRVPLNALNLYALETREKSIGTQNEKGSDDI